jgi:hypothetical protein
MNVGSRIFTIFILLAIGFFALSGYFHGSGDEASISEISGKVINNIEGERILVDSSNSNFEFEGYAIGKSHVGTFEDFSGSLILNEGVIVGAEGIIFVKSVNTGIVSLDNHLQSGDFFDAEIYPAIEFVSTNLENDIMTGQIEFRGITKEINFPVVTDGTSLSANFFLDVTPFNFKYVGINKDVRLAFEFVAT